MACHKIKNGFICAPNIYKFEGFLFEWREYVGPIPLRKDLEPRKNIPARFYEAVDRWRELENREKYLILD